MSRHPFVSFIAMLAIALLSTSVRAAVLDFDSAGNGQAIMGTELSLSVAISASGPNLGAAIFDTDPLGPNMNADDDDLLVDRGNILILQINERPEMTGDFFDLPDDDPDGGTLTFDWTSPVTMLSLDVVDIDQSTAVTVTLTDDNALTRVYMVPSQWTGEIPGEPGFGTLDLTTLSNQPGPFMGDATATEDAGFNSTSVVQMTVSLAGSGGIDDVQFVPEPVLGGFALLIASGLFLSRRRR